MTARADVARPAGYAITAAGPERLRWDGFQIALALLLFVQVWRIHELVPGLAIPGLPILCTLAALLLFWLDRDPRRRLRGLNQPIVRAALGILVLATVSVPASLYPRLTLAFVIKDHLRSVLLMLLIAASVRGLADLRRLAWLQMVGVTLCSVLTVAGGAIAGDGRLGIVAYYDVNDLAMLIVSTLPLVLYLWRRPAGLMTRTVLAAATLFAMVTLGRTESRGGFLALLAVGGYLLVGLRGVSRAKRMGIVALLAVLLVTVASDRYFARIETILHPSRDYNWSGQSATGRMEVWKRGIGYMAAHPILGVGGAVFRLAEGTFAPEVIEQRRYGRGFKWSAAHNSFIQVGAELGVGGLILFVALLVGAFRTLSHARGGPVGEVSVLAQVLTASLVGFVVAASFLSQAYSPYLYTLLGMTVGLARVASPARGVAPRTETAP